MFSRSGKEFYCKDCVYIDPDNFSHPLTYCDDYKKGKKGKKICPLYFNKVKYGNKKKGIKKNGPS